MKYNIIIYFSLLLYNGTFGKNLRIIGGSNADAREFAYSVSFKDFDENLIVIPTHICGGAIVSNRHILTSAHCLYSYEDKYNMIQIYTTMAASYSNSEPYYRIENIIYHPDFIKFMTSLYLKESDICVVKIIETMIFSSYLNKIDLPSTDITEGSIGVITGWGTTKFSAEFYPEQLQTIRMTVYDGSHCVFDSPLFLDYSQFCAVNQRGVGLCYGDSGNPFVYNNTLAGIASLILPCATGEPDVFTRVYYHMDFIREAMTS